MKLNALDRSVNWVKYTPYFLYRLGAIQGWVDMYKVVAAKDYQNGRFQFEPIPFVNDLYEDLQQRETPVAPALNFVLEMDGTSSPSYQNATKPPTKPGHLPDPGQPWTDQMAKSLVQKPVTDQNAPNMGEFNNVLPSMYLDYNPEIENEFEFALYISVETRSKNDLLVNQKARRTRFDDRNFIAAKSRDKAMFQQVQLVSNGLVKSPVGSLDDIEIRDKDGVRITQKWLDDMLAYLNGHKAIEDPSNPTAVKYSSRTLQE